MILGKRIRHVRKTRNHARRRTKLWSGCLPFALAHPGLGRTRPGPQAAGQLGAADCGHWLCSLRIGHDCAVAICGECSFGDRKHRLRCRRVSRPFGNDRHVVGRNHRVSVFALFDCRARDRWFFDVGLFTSAAGEPDPNFGTWPFLDLGSRNSGARSGFAVRGSA